MMMIEKVLSFWFDEIDQAQWWQKDLGFDQLIKEKFSGLHQSATCGELSHWRETAKGRLAEIIVLDQFSRNIYRDNPAAFASDTIALVLAQEAIRQGADQLLSNTQRSFIYLPFMHSESLLIHQKALELYQALGNENNLAFEIAHKNIIELFGRYPHRNQILNRASTAAELEFLSQPGSSF